MDLSEWVERPTCSVGRLQIPVGDSAKISPCVQCSCTREGVSTAVYFDGNSVAVRFFTQFLSVVPQPVCQSLRVTNCVQLTESTDLRALLADDVCRVQCAFLLRGDPARDVSDDALQRLQPVR